MVVDFMFNGNRYCKYYKYTFYKNYYENLTDDELTTTLDIFQSSKKDGSDNYAINKFISGLIHFNPTIVKNNSNCTTFILNNSCDLSCVE